MIATRKERRSREKNRDVGGIIFIALLDPKTRHIKFIVEN